MSTAVKKRRKSEAEFDTEFNSAFVTAMNSKPEDTKVHISCRLDSDVYLELKRRAKAGEGDGKYQVLMNQILRQALFSSDFVIYSAKWQKHSLKQFDVVFEKLKGLQEFILESKFSPKGTDASTWEERFNAVRGTVEKPVNRATQKRAK